MRLIDADKLSADMYHEAFEKDSGMQKWDSGCWIRYKMFENVLKAQPTVEAPDINVGNMDTTTHDSIPAETGENDGDKTSGDCISRQQAINALRNYLVEKRCPDDGTLTCRLIENEVINKLPSVHPEREKGEWVYNSPVTMKCNRCGLVIKDWDWHRFKICPNCGADMRGDKHETD